MAHLLTGDDKFRDLGGADGRRSDVTRHDLSGDYRFARPHAKRGAGCAAPCIASMAT